MRLWCSYILRLPVWTALAPVVCMGLATPTPAAALTLGAIGDSYTNEYTAGSRNDHANWVQQLAGFSGINFGPSPSNPYNYASSGETTWDKNNTSAINPQTFEAIDDLAGIDYLVINLGINNFAGWVDNGSGENLPLSYKTIYDGNDQTFTHNLINKTFTNLRDIVNTLNAEIAANSYSTRIVLANVPDWGATLGFQSGQVYDNRFDFTGLNGPEGRQRVADAVTVVNNGLYAFANSLGIPVIDTFGLLNLALGGDFPLTDNAADPLIDVDDASIGFDGFNQGDRFDFWGDPIHAGTVFHGLFANTLLTALNEVYGETLNLLTADNVLDAHAGSYNTQGDFGSLWDFGDFVLFNELPPLLPGDANNDGVVNGRDLLAVEQHFGATGAADGYLLGDANDDGVVNRLDLIAVEHHYGSVLPEPPLPSVFIVPEPTTLLALTGGLLLILRRR